MTALSGLVLLLSAVAIAVCGAFVVRQTESWQKPVAALLFAVAAGSAAYHALTLLAP